MGRELPAGLSDTQRIVLSEFYAGRISAGQLTQRLGIEAQPTSDSSSSERQFRVQAVESEVSAGRAARTAGAAGRRLAVRRAVEGLLGLAPRRTHI
jgi:hypothetical protein